MCPYIKRERRLLLKQIGLDKFLNNLFCQTISEGELNFIITRLLHRWIVEKGESYAEYNKLVGVLECAKLELYRKLIANYEDKKCEENGEI